MLLALNFPQTSQLHVFFFIFVLITDWVQLMLLTCAWLWGHQREHYQPTTDHIPMTKRNKIKTKTQSYFPPSSSCQLSLGMELLCPSLLHAGMLTGFILWRSCPGWAFMGVAILWYPELGLPQSSTTLTLLLLCLPWCCQWAKLLLCWGLRAALIYWFRDVYLEGSWLLCLLSTIRAVDSLLGL